MVYLSATKPALAIVWLIFCANGYSRINKTLRSDVYEKIALRFTWKTEKLKENIKSKLKEKLKGKIKRKNLTSEVTWNISRQCPPYNLSKQKFYLCLNEKTNSYKENSLLKKKIGANQ